MSTNSVSAIVQARADRLLHRFHHDMAPPKMALGGAEIRQNMARIWGNGAWEPVPGHRESDVMMWRDNSDPHASSVWAFPAFAGYRGAYMAFLKAAYGLSAVALPGQTDVDHLQAKSTVPPSSVIRLEAVGASPNRSHGASPEKKMARSTVTAGRMARDHTPGSMTWLVALKLAGVLAPNLRTSASAQARRNAALAYFTSRGWPRHEVEAGLAGLFEVQARRA